MANGYVFGWVFERRLIRHSGAWSGTSTYLRMDLEHGLTVAVLSNDEDLEAGDLAEKTAQLFADE